MKNHFRNSHADFWLKNHAHCDKYCKEQGVCALQCHYCGKQTVERGNALAHMKRCTVLWQTAVLHFALQDGGCCRSSSSGGRVLREGAGISAEEDSHGRRRHTSATKDERKAQRYKGPAKGWYRSGGGKSQGSSGDHEPSPDCPRGCHPDPAPWYGFYLVPQVRGSDDSTRPLSSSRGMASRSGEIGANHCRQETPPRRAVPHGPQEPECQPEKLAEGCSPPGDEQKAGMDHGRGPLAVPEVGSRHAHPDCGQQSPCLDNSDHLGHFVARPASTLRLVVYTRSASADTPAEAWTQRASRSPCSLRAGSPGMMAACASAYVRCARSKAATQVASTAAATMSANARV